jgi:acyl-CoA synthetase (AMP-forming)/AMP-acid ligase II/thioesterase domain-containing protein
MSDGRGARSIVEILDGWAAATPEAPALLGIGRQPLPYGGLRDLVAGVGSDLRQLGIGRSDRVVLVLRNGPEAGATFLGVAAAAACAPLNPAYRKPEFDFYLADLAPAAVVVEAESDSEVRGAARERGIAVLELHRVGDEAGRFRLVGSPGAPSGDGPGGPGDVALLLHTSGTTSRPKLVPLTHANLCISARNVAASLELANRDRCLNVMPLFHVHGLVGAVLASLHAGASVVCTPGLHAPSFFSWLEDLEPTWYTAVPTMHQAVLGRARGDVAHGRLRFVRSSSAPLPLQVAEGLEAAFGAPAIEAYGMTEAAHQIASNPLPPGERRPGSVGRATGPEVAILDDEGCPLPPGSNGEVAIRGESVFGGYLGSPDTNESAVADGWFRTGDEGLLDGDGYLFLRGRRKEIINRGGEKVAPAEVEDALLAHPSVGQAVVFAVPDERLGEEVGAAVVPREGSTATESELQQFVAGRLADFKVPRVVTIVAEIPVGPTGKLQRLGMAQLLGIEGRETAPGPVRSEPRTAVERRLVELWREILDVDEVETDDDFFAAGGDSLLAAEVVSRLQEEGWPELSLTVLVWAPTIAKLAAELERGPAVSTAALVPIQEKGDRRALFFVHALDGEVVRFGALARCLGPDQPFYGLKALGVEEQETRHTRIEEMAGHYLSEVRAVQPRGPYLLGALCMGAPIAIEMARTLVAQGDEVPLLVLVDPHVPVAATWSRARRLAERARRALGKAPKAEPYGDLNTPYLRRMAAIRDEYVMARYPGSVAVVLSDEHAPLGWLSAVEGRKEAHELGGVHMELLRWPAVEGVAERIGQALASCDPSGRLG